MNKLTEVLKETRYPLDIQMFADDPGNDPGNDPANDPDPNSDPEPTVSKKLFDKQMKEVARLKKELKEKRTEEETRNAEQQEKDDRIKELEDYQRKTTLSTGLLKGGVGNKDVDAISDAYIDSNPESLAKAITDAMNNLIKEKDDEIKKLKLEAIDRPSDGGNDEKEITKEDFDKMTIDERIALKIKDPELFKQFSNK